MDISKRCINDKYENQQCGRNWFNLKSCPEAVDICPTHAYNKSMKREYGGLCHEETKHY